MRYSLFLQLLLAAFAFLVAGSARAHSFGPGPDLGELIQHSDLIVRGTIADASRVENGALVAGLRVDAVLRGRLADESTMANPKSGATKSVSPTRSVDARPSAPILLFSSDPNHGVRYAHGERVVVFSSGRSPNCTAPACPPYSPQLFDNKFRITSFDPTGFDGLVAGYSAAVEISEPALRDRELRLVLGAQLGSPEKAVRDFVARRLNALPPPP